MKYCNRGYGVSYADPVRGLAVTCQTKEQAASVADELNAGRTTLQELYAAHEAQYQKDPNVRVPYVWPQALRYELADARSLPARNELERESGRRNGE